MINGVSTGDSNAVALPAADTADADDDDDDNDDDGGCKEKRTKKMTDVDTALISTADIDDEYNDGRVINSDVNDTAANAGAVIDDGDHRDVKTIIKTTSTDEMKADRNDVGNKATSGSNLRLMVAARVFVGRYTVGLRTYRKPPPLDPTQPFSACYDSCVNYMDDPTLFVVFDSSQCYPEYFITYCCRAEQNSASTF